jgi:biopolymer transport protein ExbD
MNMTPMIDVVFQLLIFFMTCTQVSRINNERLELPQQPGTQEQAESTLTINVNQAGEIIVSGNRLTVPQLVGIVGDEIALRGGDVAGINVVLRADQRGDSRVVNEVVRTLAQLQITRIRIAVAVPQ